MKTITKFGLAVLLFLFTGLFSPSFAQSHNVKALGCKYYQKSGNGAAVNTYEVCTVCKDKKEKEQKAKQAEDKRRQEALVAKTKADNERKAKEAAEKARIEKEKNKPTNAVIAVSPSTGGKSTVTKAAEKMEEGYLYISDFPYSIRNFEFENDGANDKNLSKGFTFNGKDVFADKFRRCYGKVTQEGAYLSNFPKNIGLVELIERNKIRDNLYTPIFDLITTSGERILKDNRISYIEFLGNNDFLIYRGPIDNNRGIHLAKDTRKSEVFYRDAYIYNIKSKKQIFIKGYDTDFGVINNAKIDRSGWDDKYCQGDVFYFTEDLSRWENGVAVWEYNHYCYSNNSIKIMRRTTSDKGKSENITLLKTIPLN